MKAYISISFSNRNHLQAEINAIKEVLIKNGIEPLVFVEKYYFQLSQEKEMMQQAMNDINDCDIFIAEVSDKAIGIGVEAGYAKTKNKTVIYVRNKKAEHSTTISGISNYSIHYNDINELKSSLTTIIKNIVE